MWKRYNFSSRFEFTLSESNVLYTPPLYFYGDARLFSTFPIVINCRSALRVVRHVRNTYVFEYWTLIVGRWENLLLFVLHELRFKTISLTIDYGLKKKKINTFLFTAPDPHRCPDFIAASNFSNNFSLHFSNCPSQTSRKTWFETIDRWFFCEFEK